VTNATGDRTHVSPGRRLEKGARHPSETFCTQLETRVAFFIFCRNPLKSPDSDEEIQGNQSFLLGFIWEDFALWLNPGASVRLSPAPPFDATRD
jgi:hypothetical protein